MFSRKKIDSFDLINMCNQFLLVYLIKKVDGFEARGLAKPAMVYRNAIYSIKRYPLPIICKIQLQSISGIGDYLSQQLEKVIKSHYSQFLDRNLNRIDSKIVDQSKNKSVTQKLVLHDFQQIQEDQKSQDHSTKSETFYKPRINTANAYFLQVLRDIVRERPQLQEMGVSENIIRQIVKLKFPSTKNKAWNNIHQTLSENGYISVNRQEQNQKQKIFFRLTEKCSGYLEDIDSKSKINHTKNKIANQVKIFQQKIQYQSINTKKLLQLNTENTCSLTKPDQDQVYSKIRPQLLLNDPIDISYKKLTLIIDSREKKEKGEEENFFLQKISKKFSIDCQNLSLSLGDFLWTYENKVLDYIIERKKADDLAASIMDGRYKDQKYRLRNCGISNIFYIYEGYPSDNCCLSEKQLISALLKTRTKQNFKVYRTKDVNESMNLLNTLHTQIYQNILQNKVKYLCSLNQFIKMNSVQLSMTVQKVFGLGLMSVAGVGKNSIKAVMNYFKTFRSMYFNLQKLNSDEERVEFLKILFKGTGIVSNLPRILVDLLFSECYDEQAEKQEKNSLTTKENEHNLENSISQEKEFSVIREDLYNEDDCIQEDFKK